MHLSKDIGLEMRSSIWYVFANIFSKVVAFAFLPIFTGIMTTEEIGTYSLYVSWLGILSVLTSLQMHGSISYRALLRHENNASFILTASLASFSVSFFFLILYIIFHRAIDSFTGLSFTVTIIMILQIFINSVEGFIFAHARFNNKYKWVSIINVITGTLSPIVALILIKRSVDGALSRILAPFAISILFTVGHLLITKNRRSEKFFSKSIYKFLISEGLTMLSHFITLSMIANADKIIISHLLGKDSLGAYTVGYSTAYMTVPLTSGISSAFIPWLTKNSSAENIEKIKKRFSEILLFSLALILAFFTLLPEIFAFIARDKPDTALLSAYILTVSFILSFIGALISSITLCYTRSSVVLCTLISFFIGVIFIVPLTNLFGITGGAIASLISNLSLLLTNLYLCKRKLGESVIGGEKIILFFSLISLGFILLWQTREYPSVRIPMFILFSLLFIIIIYKILGLNRKLYGDGQAHYRT